MGKKISSDFERKRRRKTAPREKFDHEKTQKWSSGSYQKRNETTNEVEAETCYRTDNEQQRRNHQRQSEATKGPGRRISKICETVNSSTLPSRNQASNGR